MRRGTGPGPHFTLDAHVRVRGGPKARCVVERRDDLSRLGNCIARDESVADGEQLRELIDECRDGTRRRDRIALPPHPIAHVRSSVSAIRRASMSGSTAPSRMAGRLCDVKPMR